MSALVLTLLLTFAPAEVDAEAERSRTQHELMNLKDELEQRRAALRDLDNEERSLIITLGELDQTLAKLTAVQDEAIAHEEKLKAEMEKLEAALEKDKAALDDVRARLERRLRGLYVLGEGGAVRHLLQAQSFEDFAYRRRLLKTLADSDVRLVREHDRLYRALEERKRALGLAVDEAKATSERIKVQADLLAESRQERTLAIERIEQEKELGVRRVKEIVQQQNELRLLIAKLSKKSGGRKSQRGILKEGLTRPLKGTLIRGFGTERDDESRAKLTSNGLHIRARRGDLVLAPADGQVVYTGWMRGFGQIVILDHDDGIHSLLAHLSRIDVERGDVVRRGETVGAAGDTESLEGDKLYFELRTDGRPIDPSAYLTE